MSSDQLAELARRIERFEAQLESTYIRLSLALHKPEGRTAFMPVAETPTEPLADADTNRRLHGELEWLLGSGVRTLRQWVKALVTRDLDRLTKGKLGKLDPAGALRAELVKLRADDAQDDPVRLCALVRAFSDPA